MASGHPDWGQAQSTALVASVPDLGEHAARLGSPDTLTRTGNVLYLTEFEDGREDWNNVNLGGGGSATVVTTTPFRSPNTVQLATGTLVGGGYGLLKTFVPPRTVKVGIETMVSIVNSGQQFVIEMLDYNGSAYGWFRLRYDVATATLAYQDSSGTFKTIASGLSLRTGAGVYHLFKLIVDLNTQTYVRAIVNQVSYDLTGIAPQTFVSVVNPSLDVRLIGVNQVGAARQIQLDSVIFTFNEP